MGYAIDVRSQWDQIQSGEKKKALQELLPSGEFNVTIYNLKFFEANEKLPSCIAMRLEVVTGKHKGEKISSTSYFGSRKSILYWRTSIKKILPRAFEINFNDVLAELETLSRQKKVIKVELSYSSNGNGKQYTNVKYIELVKETVEHPIAMKNVTSSQETF